MVAQRIADRIAIGLQDHVQIEGMHNGAIFALGKPEDLPETARFLTDDLQGRFIVSVGTDRRHETGCFEVNNVFGLDPQKVFLVLRTEVEVSEASVPSITPIIPGANWAEREVRDMIGVTPLGHPDLRRLVLPDDWPEGIYPLRRDFRFDEHPAPAQGNQPAMKPLPPGSSVLPLGPFFPTLEEPVFISLFVHGEKITGMDYRGFYNHRGVEKLADSALTYQQIPFLAERICGICGFVHSSSYCQAVENAAGIQVPDRGRFIRTILLELERVHSHLLWIGLACHFIGFDTLFMQAWRIREPVMWLTEYITGNRKTYGINRIGGVSRDLPADARSRIRQVINQIETETMAVVDAILEDSSLKLRLQGSGVLSAPDARAYCVVGPTARGSGIDIDARRDHPFAAYPDLEFEVCVENSCDNWGRTMVRIRELGESIKIIRQALNRLPEGPISAEVEAISPGMVGVSSVEAPRGEVHHYVRTGQGQRPERWRVRAPTYNNLQSIPKMLEGMTIADAPISLGSIDPCFSCTERMGVIDQSAGTMRIYSQEELLRLSHGKVR